MLRMTKEKWELLIGEEWYRIEMCGGGQLGRHFSFLDSGAAGEEEED
jgi:hypothetical protein